MNFTAAPLLFHRTHAPHPQQVQQPSLPHFSTNQMRCPDPEFLSFKNVSEFRLMCNQFLGISKDDYDFIHFLFKLRKNQLLLLSEGL